jgi:hypothetical protein
MEMIAKQPFHYFGDGGDGRYVEVGQPVEIRDDLAEGLKAAGYVALPGAEPAETRSPRSRRKR